MEEGRSQSTLQGITYVMTSLERHLPLEREIITPEEIQVAAEKWAPTVHRSAKCLHVGKREFVFHATKWLHLLGRLRESPVQQPFPAEMGAFLRFLECERALSPSTMRHYRLYVGEFLCWLNESGRELSETTLDDMSCYINVLSQRKLKRTSLAIHIAKLRNFFRYAESKHWCRRGLSALDAPRIYRLENLPRGPEWNDVQRLLASCAGNTRAEIRDRAMLLLIAVYGLRSGEVRYLRLEDIDWEQEIIHVRRVKQRKSQCYPLVHEAGAAILRYISEVRPRCKQSEVFLSLVRPYALSAEGFGTMVRNRLHRLGTVSLSYGPDSLRHSCATHLLAEGVSLKEIADHLGHASLVATQIYAKVDLPGLREVGELPLSELTEYAEDSARNATPLYPRGNMEALRNVASFSLGGLL
jgi:site-specific recombinase XerD